MGNKVSAIVVKPFIVEDDFIVFKDEKSETYYMATKEVAIEHDRDPDIIMGNLISLKLKKSIHYEYEIPSDETIEQLLEEYDVCGESIDDPEGYYCFSIVKKKD